MTNQATIDFETYSEAGYKLDPVAKTVKGLGSQGKGGLPVVGTPAYAEHPSTDVLCLYYDLHDGQGVRGWLPGFPAPADLLNHVCCGGTVRAWNVTFEFYIWNTVCARRYGWPPLPLEQCVCDMAQSRRYSLPGSLATAAKVLGTADKDKAGKQLIQKLTRPHKPTKKRPEFRWTPTTAWQDFVDLYAYCGQDVAAEDAASARIPELSPHEHAVWQLDQRVNVRGVQVDVDALDAALDILEQAERRYTMELVQITQGAVGGVGEVEKLREWLAKLGVVLPNLQKDTVSEALEHGHMTGNPRRALEIRETLGAANVKKLRTLKLQVSSDGRLRDQYMYCGADRTGRWSAGGVQLQNITSKGPKSHECEACGGRFGEPLADLSGKNPDCCPRCGSFMFHKSPEWTVEAVEYAIKDILTRDLNVVEAVWGDPVALLCGCLRGLFIARPGHDLICCDFSAIEAVVAACLSRCQWRIDVFAGKGNIYEMSAAKITGTPIEVYEAYKAENGMHHPDRKKIGKVAELASGYGGWINAWKQFGADMPDDEIKAAVLRWREESPEIVEMWGGQFVWCGPGKWDYRPQLHGLEGAAILAIQNPGYLYQHNDIGYHYDTGTDVLYCVLPSGRKLHYHRPRLEPAEDKLRRGPAVSITFEGYNSNAAKGLVGWVRMDTFGGRLFENVVQAVARDIQADALLRCEQHGYHIVMHTHDEGTAEVPEGWGSVEEMEAVMSVRPEWASWWPIKAAGWRHKRYQKD